MLGRLFEHRKMKGACARKVDEIEKLFKQKQPDSPELASSKHLYGIATAFIQAYGLRNNADYETATNWDRTAALSLIAAVSAAFESWKAIKHEPVAQAFLFSLLEKDR